MNTGVLEKDPVRLAPEKYNVLVDNDNVRVLEICLKPGERVVEHSHPKMVIYALSDGRARFHFPDGNSEMIELKAGQAVYTEPMTHSPENIGTSEIHVLNIELKK